MGYLDQRIRPVNLAKTVLLLVLISLIGLGLMVLGLRGDTHGRLLERRVLTR